MESKEIIYELLGEGGSANVVKVLREKKFFAKKIFRCSKNPKTPICCENCLKFYNDEKSMNEFIKQKSTKCHYIMTSENFEEPQALYFELGKSALAEYLSNLQNKSIKDEKIMDSMIYILLEGLKEIHENNIIHKDIKPLNLIIVQAKDLPNAFTIKYADFGISQVFQTGVYLESEINDFHFKNFWRTEGYLAPEATEFYNTKSLLDIYPHDPRKIDVYALGLVIQRIIKKGSTEIRKNPKYLIFEKMLNNIETRPSLGDIFKEIDTLSNFHKEKTFVLDSGAEKILNRSHMSIMSQDQNFVTMCCLVKEIFVYYTFDNYESGSQKIDLLKEKLAKSVNIEEASLMELKILSDYLDISITTETDLDKAAKLYSDAKSYSDKVEGVKNRNFMLTYYTLLDTKIQIDLHQINEKLLNSEEIPPQIYNNIEKELRNAISKKEDLLKSDDPFPADIYSNLNFLQNCVSCYYSLCCIYWHTQEFTKIIDVIANKVLKIHIQIYNENCESNEDIPFEFHIFYYPWLLLAYLMKSNKENQDIKITKKKCQKFFESVPNDYKLNYQSKYIRPIVFLNLWSMFILYSYYENVEFDKNFKIFSDSICYFLEKNHLSKNSNQYYICLMVCKRMNKKLGIEKSENEKSEYFNQQKSIKEATNYKIAENVNIEKKSFDLKKEEETKHNL